MGTVLPYSPKVPKRKYEPTDEVTARMTASKDRYDQIEKLMEQVKADVIEFAELGVPVLTLAELYGVQRKTIYRWMGQEMS